MGRGRQKAKQTKVARELKYHSSSIDVNALQRELSGDRVDPVAEEDEDEEDEEYGQYGGYSSYGDDEDAEDDEDAPGYVTHSRSG